VRSIHHFIAEEETFERRIKQRISSCKESILATAFFTWGAFEALRDVLLESLQSGATFFFLIGRYDFITEPRAVEALIRLSKQYPATMRVFFDSEFTFHFKLATFRVGVKKIIIIGSSNLTPKGLGSVGEDNLEIVGNQTAYSNAKALLEDRIRTADLAEDVIDDYRRRYNRARTYRQQRAHWDNLGRKAWSRKRKRSRPIELSNGPLPFCWIGEVEDDKTLKRNIERQHARAQAQGHDFPNQWVNLEIAAYARQMKEDGLVVLRNDLSRSFGFAICTRKFDLLNENDRRKPIMFYRFCRGLRAHFTSTGRYERACKKLRFADRWTAGPKLVQTLTKYLGSHRG